MPAPTLSRGTLLAMRELAAKSVVRQIDVAWQSEGFTPACDPGTLGLSERRALFQAYVNAIDLTDERHVERVVRVFDGS
jgi:hypothetical protein